AANFFVDVNLRPIDELFAGGHLAFAQRASYVLGPTWSSVDLQVQALDLWNGVAYLEWRPVSWIRLGYNFHTQSTGVFFAGIKTSTGSATLPASSEPRFTDNEVTLGFNVPDLGMIRPGVRYRIRPDRKEVRAGLSYDMYKLFGLFDGWFSRGFGAIER